MPTTESTLESVLLEAACHDQQAIWAAESEDYKEAWREAQLAMRYYKILVEDQRKLILEKNNALDS